MALFHPLANPSPSTSSDHAVLRGPFRVEPSTLDSDQTHHPLADGVVVHVVRFVPGVIVLVVVDVLN